MSIWIIKNLAVADICHCLLVLLPTLLTQYGKLNKTLIFGETFYSALGCYGYTFLVANLLLVNVLTFNKLMRCMFPLRNLDSTTCQRILVTNITAVYSSVPAIWIVYGHLDGFVTFSNDWREMNNLGASEIASANNINQSGYTKMIDYALTVIFSALPCFTLMALNLALVIFAVKRSNSGINKSNLVIVFLMTATVLISIIPHFIDIIFISINENSSVQWREYSEIAWSLIYLSSLINPFIYFSINPSFREFTKKKLFFCKSHDG